MNKSRISQTIIKEYAKYTQDVKKHPEYILSYSKFSNCIHDVEPFWEYIVKLQYTDGGAHMVIVFDNGNSASIINNFNTDYKWKLLSPSIKNDDCLLEHLSLREITNYLYDIKMGNIVM